ncbi:hypothetical protein RN001_004872 [Aquatica leii]|uniref:PID domain-containing protein n=1 Tax=Aquatica leii TaxID=1421715 RepID=A0AAN7QJV3_9COLE|nr:hypothetical protein RN001_004872 [Aquatica leii]
MNTRSGNKKMEENVENLDNMKKNEDISQEQVIETQQNMENRQEKQGQDEAIQMLIGMMIEAKRTRQEDKEEAKEKEKLQEERYIKDKEEAKKLRQEENEKLEEFKKEIRNILRREEAKQANILDERIQTVRGEIKEVEEKQQEIREEFNQRFEENKKNLELETKRNAIEFKQELIRIDNENADITKSVMKNEEAIYRLSITVNNELKKNVEKINLEMTNKNLELKRFAQGYKYGMVQEGIYRTSNSHNERNNFRDYRYQQDQPRFGQNWYNNSRFREENRNQQGYHNYNFREHGYRNNFNRNFSNNENNYNQPRNREGNQNQNGHNENRERRHYNEDRRESNFRPNRTFENNNIQSEENNQIQGRGRGCRGPQRGRAYYINNMNLREVEENNHCGSNNEEEEVINETVTGEIVDKHMEILKKAIIPMKNINLVTANNKNIKIVYNMVVGNLKMGNTEHSHGLIMMNNMRMDCLLGINALEKFKVKLDLEKKIIEINKEESNWKKSEEYNGLMMSMKLNNMNEANEEDIKINCPDDKKEEIESLLNESPGLFYDEQRIGIVKKKAVLLVISLAGIKVCSPDGKSVYMAHALRRISYATCDPEQAEFSFFAREPKGHFSVQYCHCFKTRTPEQFCLFVFELWEDLTKIQQILDDPFLKCIIKS